MKECDFMVGDLVAHKGRQLKWPRMAVVVGVETMPLFHRMKIQYFDTDEPEMVDPSRWSLVSRPQ